VKLRSSLHACMRAPQLDALMCFWWCLQPLLVFKGGYSREGGALLVVV
jgi:hypothetical protein